MKCSNVRGGAVLLIGFSVLAALSGQANAGWGHRHGSYGGSSGFYGVGYGSSGAYSSYGSSGGSSGYGSYGASYGSSGAAYGSSGASYGSSGYYGSTGRVTLGERLHAHFAAKQARHAARRASYGSSGYYASSGGYSSSGGSSGYSSYSSTGGSSGYSAASVYSGGSSGSVYSSGVSYGSVGGAVSSGYYGASRSSTPSSTSYASNSSVVSRVDGDAVYLTVAVPTNAKVFVNNKATTSTGRVREFVSRGLKPGSSYKFEIRAELESVDGQVMSESKNLVVQAGAREQIQFAFADQAKPIETAVTLNVPEGAKVYLAGNPTSASGATRTFRTSKLVPGESWDDYEIEVRHGDQVKQKSIRVKAGDQLKLTFAFDDTTEASKLAAR